MQKQQINMMHLFLNLKRAISEQDRINKVNQAAAVETKTLKKENHKQTKR
jgi:hypothetical protein